VVITINFMRLVQYCQGGFRPVFFGTRGTVRVSEFESRMQKFVKEDGQMSALCIDFCGRYIPLVHQSDIGMSAKLLAAYYNDGANAETQVSMIEKTSSVECNGFLVGGSWRKTRTRVH